MEGVVDDVREEVRLGADFDLCVRVPLVGQRAYEGDLSALVGVFVEARSFPEGAGERGASFGGDGGRQGLEAIDLDVPVEHRRPFLDDDLDPHVASPVRDDPGCAGVGFEEALAAVVAFDAREVALQRRRIEDRIVEDDAAKETEELGARGGGELVLGVPSGDLVCAENVDDVDGRTTRRNRRARTQGERGRGNACKDGGTAMASGDVEHRC